MGRAPWFKLYAADYLLDPDVDTMPREAEALLLRMWCVCSREGSCPSDPETLARKTLCTLEYVLQCKPHCDRFFELRDGKLYSRRMEEEKQRSEQARKNANHRWNRKPKSESKSESESESERGNANCIATRTPVIPPAIEEVVAYCRERQNHIDPQHWYDHYSANGWMVGRNRMRDWKAAIRTWEKNGADSKNGNSNRAERRKVANIAAGNEAVAIMQSRMAN